MISRIRDERGGVKLQRILELNELEEQTRKEFLQLGKRRGTGSRCRFKTSKNLIDIEDRVWVGIAQASSVKSAIFRLEIPRLSPP